MNIDWKLTSSFWRCPLLDILCCILRLTVLIATGENNNKMNTILYSDDTVTRNITIFFILDIRYQSFFIDLDECFFLLRLKFIERTITHKHFIHKKVWINECLRVMRIITQPWKTVCAMEVFLSPGALRN